MSQTKLYLVSTSMSHYPLMIAGTGDAARREALEAADDLDASYEGMHIPPARVLVVDAEVVERKRPYDAEAGERAAIQADAENERDGYRD